MSSSSGSLSSRNDELSFDEASEKFIAHRQMERKGKKKRRGGSLPGKRPNKNRNQYCITSS